MIPGISRVGPLRRQTGVVLSREGGDPSVDHCSLGTTAFEPILLERGKTQDRAFEDWADLVWSANAAVGQEVALKEFRKSIRIELLNEAGQVVLAYVAVRCWPSSYQALPALDATSAAVAIESLVLECEGWQRDPSVVEPAEP